MIKLCVILIAICSISVLPQEKYFIYFKDKVINSGNILDKSHHLYAQAIDELSDKAIKRRMKNMGEEFITYEDIPIAVPYIDSLKKSGIQIVHQLKWFNSVSAYLDDADIHRVEQLDFVDRIERVKSIVVDKSFVDDIVADKQFSILEYGQSFTQLNLSDIPVVHSKGITGENILVGLLDTGFDWQRHISLKDQNVVAEYDFIFQDSITANQSADHPQQHNHGTYVLSVIGGFHDSVMIGAAYKADFLLAKTEDIRSERRIEEDNYAAALIWMESLGVDVTSSSLGYSIFDSPEDSYSYNDMNGITTIVTRAAELAFLRGVSTFSSAGNEGSTNWRYITAPADGKNIISVGAVTSDNQLAAFSSRGPTADGRIKPEVVAMGTGVFGAVAGTNENYFSGSGTSASAPIACGVGTLLLSAHPHLKNTQVRSIILESAGNSDNPNNNIGYGLISAKNAIEFPNLEYSNNHYVLRKFLFDEGVIPNSVSLNYTLDGENFDELIPEYNPDYSYLFHLPEFLFDQQVQFFFTYRDNQNINHRVPEIKNYLFSYGSLEISLNLPLKNELQVQIVSNIFPNPFVPAEHGTVKIYFRSQGNEIFNLKIIDGAGQNVKNVFLISEQGINTYEWNGISDGGIMCASGAYYFLIQLNGREFGRKLILLN